VAGAYYRAHREGQLKKILDRRRRRIQAETPEQRAARTAKRRKWYRRWSLANRRRHSHVKLFAARQKKHVKRCKDYPDCRRCKQLPRLRAASTCACSTCATATTPTSAGQAGQQLEGRSGTEQGAA